MEKVLKRITRGTRYRDAKSLTVTGENYADVIVTRKRLYKGETDILIVTFPESI